MATVQNVLDAIEALAPQQYAAPNDPVGLQLGSPDDEVCLAIVSLDPSLAAAQTATADGAGLLVTHHPLIFHPLPSVRTDMGKGAVVGELLRGGVAHIAAHTNWDCAVGGVSDTLAERIGLRSVRPFGQAAPVPSLKLVTFVPKESVEKLVDALARAGAGCIGLYERCAFLSPGSGTFRGREGSQPAVGEPGVVVNVEEVRVEMALPTSLKAEVHRALLAAHPYEAPAFDFLVVESPGCAIGRVGELDGPLSPKALHARVERELATRCLTWSEHPGSSIRRVAVAGGSGADLWREALAAGAQALVTGEVPQHVGLEASEAGLTVLAAGHYATEQPGAQSLAEELAAAVPEVEFRLFEPEPGQAGRPM